MKKQRVLITGGSGLLALNWACAVREKWDVILGTHLHSVDLAGTTSRELDLSDYKRLKHQLDKFSPDLIVHTAGLTNVDLCTEDLASARFVNAEIARNVAQVSAIRGVNLIHISTDHLFGGEHSFYREDDMPKPLNEYGRSKLLAEEWVQQACPKALIVRTNFFGWGHAKRQSFSDWIIYSLRAGKPLSLFDDVYFTPILADSLAVAAHGLVEKGASGVFNLVGDERISKYEFALQLGKCFSMSVELIRSGQIANANLHAPRPRDMSLDNGKARQMLGRGLGTIAQFLSALYTQEIEGRRLELYEAVC